VNVRVDAAGGDDEPFAASTSVVTPTTMPFVTPAITSGLPALPMPTMRPCLMPMSALKMPVQSMMSALVMTTSSASSPPRRGLAHAVAQHLAAAELALVAVDGGVALDARDEPVSPRRTVVASGGAVDVGVVLARNRKAHGLLPGSATNCTELGLTGLEAHRRARGNVEAHGHGGARSKVSARLVSSEGVVAADLNGPVAGVGHREVGGAAALVQGELALGDVRTGRARRQWGG
jgi:hypothetical protein